VNLAGIRRVNWTKKFLFGGPQGYAASSCETFRIVSLGTWVNKGKKKEDQGLK
jgi:hypothetical protein